MGRARKEPLSDEAVKIAEEWDKKISDVRKKKEIALKRVAEKQHKERMKLADKVINALYDVCNEAVDAKMVERFTDYMQKHKKEIMKEVMPNKTQPEQAQPDASNMIGVEKDDDEGDDTYQ